MSKKYKYVGKFYKTNNYGIIEILKYNHTDKYGHNYYKIRFLKSGQIRFRTIQAIRKGEVGYRVANKYDKEVQGKYYQDSFEYYNKSFRKYAFKIIENSKKKR